MPPIERMKAASLRGEIVDGFVGGDAVFVEAGRLLARLEDRTVDAGDGEFMGASQARRPCADDRDPLPGRRAARVGRFPIRNRGLGRIALQLADHDRLRLRRLAHAGFLAQRFGRADAGAHAAHDVGIENSCRRARAVAGSDLANEQRNVDRGRAGLLAGRIEAEIAALRLHPRLVRRQQRMQIGEIAFQRRFVQASRADVRCARRVGGDRHDETSKAWRRLILDRLVNRFATRNICQAGYGPRAGVGP